VQDCSKKGIRAKKQINPFTPLDRTPTCGRQTDRHGHRAMASTRASITSRGRVECRAGGLDARFGGERARIVCCTVETRLGGLTAFTLAAELGHRDVIALFIELGADLNSRNATGGWTPLHCAVSQGFMQVFRVK